MKKTTFRKAAVILGGVLVISALSSCGIFGKPKLNLNMDGVKALGTAGQNGGARFVGPDYDGVYARAAEDDITVELKKITEKGSSSVISFPSGADTSDFIVKSVLQDPRENSSDVYLVLDHPALVDTMLGGEVTFSQILAIHSDGTYTNVLPYDGSEKEYGWLLHCGSQPETQTMRFDVDGNLYFVFITPDKYGSALYKYNPETRKTVVVSKMDSINNWSFINFEISKDGKWIVITQNCSGQEVEDTFVYYTETENLEKLFSANRSHNKYCFDTVHDTLYRYSFDNDYSKDCCAYEREILSKIELKNGTFNADSEEVFDDFEGTVSGLFYTSSGLWVYVSDYGEKEKLINYIDENGIKKNEVYPVDSKSLDLKEVNGKIYILYANKVECFDTNAKAKTCSDVFEQVPNRDKLKIQSYSVNMNELYYSAVLTDTNGKTENVNGVINLENLDLSELNAKDSFTSIAICNNGN